MSRLNFMATTEKTCSPKISRVGVYGAELTGIYATNEDVCALIRVYGGEHGGVHCEGHGWAVGRKETREVRVAGRSPAVVVLVAGTQRSLRPRTQPRSEASARARKRVRGLVWFHHAEDYCVPAWVSPAQRQRNNVPLTSSRIPTQALSQYLPQLQPEDIRE